MRINLLSSFAAGILLTTSICSVVYFSGKNDVAKASVKQELTVNEMKDKLATAGYVIQTKDEYDKTVKNAKTTSQKKSSTETKKPAKVVTRVNITVADGMTSYDVGQMLLNAKLIQKGAFDFSKDIEKRKIEKNLKPGTYVVDSGMTYEQIISTIFKK